MFDVDFDLEPAAWLALMMGAAMGLRFACQAVAAVYAFLWAMVRAV